MFTTETRRHGEKQFSSQNLSYYAAFYQSCDVEVSDYAYVFAGQLEIGEQLRLVDWKGVLDTLQFQNHGILNDQVEAIPAVQFDAFVFNRQWHLALKGEPTQVEFAAQALLIGRFE
jgi:hypothetical protein